MYNIFELPKDFLNREYTPEEKEKFERAIQDYYHGTGEHLSEDLTDKQKAKVDTYWQNSHYVKKAHDEVFGDKDRIVVPYDASLDKPITSSNYRHVITQRGVIGDSMHHTIIEKLHAYGYRTDDYAAGLAYHKDAPERKLKINSVLSKIGVADTESNHWSKQTKLKDSRKMTYGEVFAADPVRGAAKKDKQVIITRNKYDVAGMSTGRGWTSCMNLDNGVNRHYVKHDIEHGTLTAYLCTKDDDGIHHPIGRINLKRFNNVATHHISYQPENSQYGTIPQQFPEIVKSWSEKHYPMKDAGVYQKAPELYDDDGNTLHFHKLDELDTEKALHATTENYLDTHLRATHGNGRDFKQYDHYYDGNSVGTETAYVMNKYHSKLSAKQYAHSVIHWAASHSYDNNGDAPKDIHDLDYDDVGSNEPIHSWAHDEVVSSGNKYFIQKGIKEFSPADSLVALDKIHKAMHKTEDEDHEALKIVHGKLIDHVFDQKTPEWDSVKSHTLSHMFDDTNVDYYHGHRYHTVKDSSDTMSNQFHAMLTTNPRMIHHIMNYEHDHLNESSASHVTGINHIARFADAKLAHHVMVERPEMDYWKHLSHFASSLNENKDGEHIQHTLLNQMHSDSGDDHTERNRLMYAAIANKTSFKSVHDRIKSRLNSDLNDEEIKQDHADNKHFKYATHMEAYLRYLRK